MEVLLRPLLRAVYPAFESTRLDLVLSPADTQLTAWEYHGVVVDPTSTPSTHYSDSPGHHRILVVEDDASVRELVALHLRHAGFTVLEAESATAGWKLLDRVNVVVLDRMLPDESGDAFLRRLRSDPARSSLPVLMLTARASEVDRVGGLDAGADDYLTKPFSAAELVARLRALLRRVPTERTFEFHGLSVDPGSARAHLHEDELDLTRREFELLAFLIASPGRAFTRAELLDRVWGSDFLGTERTVDQHVAQLRAKVGEGFIDTVRGRGYRLVAPNGQD